MQWQNIKRRTQTQRHLLLQAVTPLVCSPTSPTLRCLSVDPPLDCAVRSSVVLVSTTTLPEACQIIKTLVRRPLHHVGAGSG